MGASRFCFVYATLARTQPMGCMLTRTHGLLAASLALVACTQPVSQPPSGQNGSQDPQSGSTTQLRYAEPLVYSEEVNSPKIADLDGDGDFDIVVQASISGPQLTALYNRGDGSFLPADAGSLYVGLVADLNGDGRADLVGWTSLTATNLAVEIAQPGGGYSLVESPVSQASGLTYGAKIAAADVDADGRPEIVWTFNGGTSAIWIDATGKVLSTKALSSTTGLSVAPDLDGDHRAELYAIDGASVSITSSRTGTTWATAISDCTIRGVRFVDLDGDGRLDLVAAAVDRSSGALRVVTFQSNGDGSFSRAADSVIAPAAGFDDIVDIDGDGHPDVAFRNAGDPTEYFAVGDAALGFTSSAYAIPLPDADGTIQFAELNGDGRPDVVLSVGASIYVLDSM